MVSHQDSGKPLLGEHSTAGEISADYGASSDFGDVEGFMGTGADSAVDGGWGASGRQGERFEDGGPSESIDRPWGRNDQP